jgi:hypothetical protein
MLKIYASMNVHGNYYKSEVYGADTKHMLDGKEFEGNWPVN